MQLQARFKISFDKLTSSVFLISSGFFVFRRSKQEATRSDKPGGIGQSNPILDAEKNEPDAESGSVSSSGDAGPIFFASDLDDFFSPATGLPVKTLPAAKVER